MMAGTMSKTLVAAVAIAASTLSFGFAEGAPRAMRTGSVTSQPIGHYEFCQLNKAECSIISKGVQPARVTDYGWNVIKEVNASVNARIMPMTDQDIYGRDEVWAYPSDVGDCEDYVLEKRRELMRKGFSVSNLLITVVRKPDGEGHAVLTLRTIDGDFILDNLEDSVKLWSDTPYNYMKRQADYDTGRWVKIENSNPDFVVGAVKK
ncbi:transglutaminase-like cysteine peptidase [Rhizobium sp.]